LTVADGDSRFLLGCQALSSPRVAEAKPVFTRLFKAFGLPTRLRTDNGVPCATTTLGRLSHRSAWWGRLGIFPECIAPGTPQPNGRHERRHRPLKAEPTRPPARTRRAQQRTCERLREACNDQRPHEALDLQPPASRDEPSPRQMPNRLPPFAYPDRFEVRDVSANGGIRWHHPWGNVSHTCIGEDVGLEEIDDGIWTVDFGPLTLGRRRERHMRIADAYGRLTRPR
jgi:putative transposase